jgi:hypothetical protein
VPIHSVVKSLALAGVIGLPCWADAISLTSHNGGIFDYTLSTGSGIIFNTVAPVLALSGLSGVTGASILGDLANGNCDLQVSSLSAHSVTVSTVLFDKPCFEGPGSIGTLEVTSTVTTLGTVNFEIENTLTFPQNISGTTEGPVSSAVPEPANMALLLTGVALAIIRRRAF